MLRRTLKSVKQNLGARFASLAFDPSKTVVVLQMGKVGSSSVVRSIRESSFRGHVFQLHIIDREDIDRAVSRIRASARPILDEHLVYSRALHAKLLNATRPIRIVTLTREPIARALSFVFQDLQRQVGQELTSPGASRQFTEAVRSKLEDGSPHADPSAWFDTQVKQPFGIDVFSKPFDYEQAATVINGDRASVLVARMEDLGESDCEGAISEFVGANCNLTRDSANVGVDKKHGEIYRTLQESFRLPSSDLDRLVATRYFRHFYQDRIAKTIQRWSS